MTAHPVILAVIVLDGLSLFFLFRAAAGAVGIEAYWSPGSSTRRQIRLETSYETGAISARAALALLTVSTLILVWGVTNVLPEIVPGAMCGTGVLQATTGRGGRAFLFRFTATALLYLWSLFEGLNRSRPDFPLAGLNARMLLLAAPFASLAFLDTFTAFNSLDVHRPVDCCTVVYDRLSEGGRVLPSLEMDGRGWALLFAGATSLMVLFGVAALSAGAERFGRFSAAAAFISLSWGPVAAVALVRVFAGYVYEVTHHHCPWCLFLPEHGFVGFPLFLVLGGAFIQGPAAYGVYRVSRGHPDLRKAGARRGRRALIWMIVLAGLFTIVAVWPAVSWRIRFGVWMG
jgi:hypothetical protein